MTTSVPQVEQIFLQFANNYGLPDSEIALLQDHLRAVHTNVHLMYKHYQSSDNIRFKLAVFFTSKSINSITCSRTNIPGWTSSILNDAYLHTLRDAKITDESPIEERLAWKLREHQLYDATTILPKIFRVFEDVDCFCASLGIGWFELYTMIPDKPIEALELETMDDHPVI